MDWDGSVLVLNLLEKTLKEYNIPAPKKITSKRDLDQFKPKNPHENKYKYHNETYFNVKNTILNFDDYFKDILLPRVKKLKTINKSQISDIINKTGKDSTFSLKILQEASKNLKIMTYFAIKNHIDICESTLKIIKEIPESLKNEETINLARVTDNMSKETEEFIKLGFFVGAERSFILAALVADNRNDYDFLGRYYALTQRFANFLYSIGNKMVIADYE